MQISTGELVYRGAIPVITPYDTPDPTSFISELRGFLKGLGIVTRSEDGLAYFSGKTVPSDKAHENFLPQASEIASNLKVPTFFFVYTHFDPTKWKLHKTVRSNNQTPEGFICPINNYTTTVILIVDIAVNNMVYACGNIYGSMRPTVKGTVVDVCAEVAITYIIVGVAD